MTLTAWLALTPNAPAMQVMALTSPPHPIPNRPDGSVLFVSELSDEVDMYSTALELSGFRTVHVHTPREALSVSKDVTLLAVILDAGRYRCGSSSAEAQPLGLGSRLQVPVIVLTTDGSGPDTATSRRLGWDRVLAKPCLPDALRQVLEEVLEHPKPSFEAEAPVTDLIKSECQTLTDRCRAAIQRSRLRFTVAGAGVARAQALLERKAGGTPVVTSAESGASDIARHAAHPPERGFESERQN